MQTTSYGYSKPELDDKGNIFFPLLEADIQQLNDHNHNGSNSALLAPILQTITSGGWAAVSGQPGTYSQNVTLPTGYTYDNRTLSFRLSTGEIIYPSVAKVSTSVFTVYTNDNTLAFVVLIGT